MKSNEQIIAELRSQVGELSKHNDHLQIQLEELSIAYANVKRISKKEVDKLKGLNQEAVEGIDALTDYINREGGDVEMKYVFAELGEIKLRLTGDYFEN